MDAPMIKELTISLLLMFNIDVRFFEPLNQEEHEGIYCLMP